jgi:hypothetical protein
LDLDLVELVEKDPPRGKEVIEFSRVRVTDEGDWVTDEGD